MVVFYVKNKVSKARDGYEVAGLLKEKIGNEEGFFEFGLLKVEPYSKYLYSLHNRCHFFRVFQAIEGKREASEEHQTRATGEGVIFSERPPSHVSDAPRSLRACLRSPEKREKITPVMQTSICTLTGLRVFIRVL